MASPLQTSELIPPAPLAWYSLNRDHQTVDHEPVDLAAALAIVEGYFSRLRQRYETGEEALVETMFGFSRSEHDFLELCLHADDQISVTYETRLPRRLLFITFRKIQRHELTLGSRREVLVLVTRYFELPSEAFSAKI